jgi:hypothetical protein
MNKHKNFIIVGTQRTGSTAFFRRLNMHPEIACGREWTHDIPPHKKLQVVQRALNGDFRGLSDLSRRVILEQYSERVEWLGFKWLFRSSNKWLISPRFAPALWIDRLESACDWIASNPELRVIHVVRDDSLDWLKSKYLASQTGLFARTPYPDGTKVKVPIKAALKRIRAKRYVDERLSGLSSTNPYLLVRYEDFAASNNETIERALQFLGCDPELLEYSGKPRPKKQSKGSPADYIVNWQELVDALTKEGLRSGLEAIRR